MNASTKEGSASVELHAILDNQRRAFKAEGPVALATRIDRMDRCIALLVDNKAAICAAVRQGLRLPLAVRHPDDRCHELGGQPQVRQKEPEEVDEAGEAHPASCP